jgi:hypothetical protein
VKLVDVASVWLIFNPLYYYFDKNTNHNVGFIMEMMDLAKEVGDKVGGAKGVEGTEGTVRIWESENEVEGTLQ